MKMQKSLRETAEGSIVVNEDGKRVFKTFMVVSSAFNCDKDCPYCTAKITQWPEGENNWENMEECLQRVEEAGIVFEYLTISGNGEPSFFKH